MKTRFITALILSVLVLFIWALFNIEFEMTPEEKTTIIKNGLTIEGLALDIEPALTPAAQAKGLAGRQSMAENTGMLFAYNVPARHTFTMRGMKFSLDVLWLDADWQIVDTHHELSPGLPVFSPSAPAKYVLELTGGFLAKHNLTTEANIEPSRELELKLEEGGFY